MNGAGGSRNAKNSGKRDEYKRLRLATGWAIVDPVSNWMQKGKKGQDKIEKGVK